MVVGILVTHANTSTSSCCFSCCAVSYCSCSDVCVRFCDYVFVYVAIRRAQELLIRVMGYWFAMADESDVLEFSSLFTSTSTSTSIRTSTGASSCQTRCITVCV